ncbi:bleomycin resistance protein [Denitromonas iodatirespirans]|uniref:Bleomycin resistance protein n=1 Tax=Denitromonas iodatirespirans TaxID=2795389 RepID=A0A944DHG3_DENI1|nr:VOC family protein [Denitromonas iodatirespirans]MBT0964217.1 VOC family protein [Denitromonas iodatirespirans]
MSIEPFIKCSNIKVSCSFYTETLDFKIIRAPDPDPQSFMSMYAFLERDGSFVHLSEHSGDGVFGNVIYIRVKDLNKIYNKFVKSGLKIQEKAGITMEPVTQTWGMKEFSILDPDGNRLTFGQNNE